MRPSIEGLGYECRHAYDSSRPRGPEPLTAIHSRRPVHWLHANMLWAGQRLPKRPAGQSLLIAYGWIPRISIVVWPGVTLLTLHSL